MSSGFVRAKDGGALVKLRVSPDAKRTGLRGAYGDGALGLAVSAPPVEGKANAKVGRFLAALCGVPRSAVEVVRGSSGRDKTVFVGGVAASEVREALSGRPG